MPTRSAVLKRAKVCARYTFSTLITLGSFALIIYATGNGYAILDGHPAVLSCILALVVVQLAYLEGLQVAIMALQGVDREEFRHMRRAYSSHELVTAQRGLNVQRFLVGRQFFVVFVVFLAAQLTTYSKLDIPFLPYWLCVLIISTGLPGVLFVLSFGQLMPQLIASTHPITFLNLPGTWYVIKLTLGFEAVGVTHFSWVLTLIAKFCFKLNQPDLSKISRDIPRRNIAISEHGNEPQLPNFDSFISTETMTVDIIDADALYSGGVNGLSVASKEDLENMQWIKDDSVKNLFQKWGHNKSTELPKVEDIVRHLVKNGQGVPCYLLPKHHPKHIPPHIVVMELIRKEEENEKFHRYDSVTSGNMLQGSINWDYSLTSINTPYI